MRKEGFTLAEVLITLAIIGVIAALSIPQFTADIYNKSNASKLSTIVTNYEDVFGMMLLRQDREDIFETDFGTALNSQNQPVDFSDTLSVYTKVAKVDSVSGNDISNLGYNNEILNIDGSDNTGTHALRYGVVTPEGSVLLFEQIKTNSGMNRRYSDVHIDVNGSTQPNRYGRDVFTFVLAQDGHLYPYGSRQAAIELGQDASQTWDNSTTNSAYRCTGDGYTGQGCTARLIENNYSVDY